MIKQAEDGSGDFGRRPRSPENSGLRQVSLARLTEFGVVPKRDLGQNFLIDDNILNVILKQLECAPGDVVLEVGAGLGVLTDALAHVARHVHALEIDRSLAAPLAATLQVHDNVSLHFEDVLKAPLESLEPAPTLCASNLPYSVAGPFIIEALQRLPAVQRYCVMVQREVAERMVAAPGCRTYGALSVWVQLYAQVVRTRALARSIFHPRPNVDSSLVVLERRPADRLPSIKPAQLRSVVRAAFAQRRKTLVNALVAGSIVSRTRAAEVVIELGLPPGVRAERLTPGQFVRLAEMIVQRRAPAADVSRAPVG
ncbi:MAG: 16S rRNA (adenine(1518)-N(6)/adenine(1519)-N(6))-dimethyltransferase RsmA [Thermoleophilia bacterium]|jgi:16S rRNA (adenine1518-N6/adenine1519-N6)-dimethyltransferase